MANHPPITLRYFDARGRVQFVRYYLRGRRIAFADERVPVSADFAEWRAIKSDRSLAGPFQKLPVLHWGDRVVAETLMIASFLHEALGDARTLPDDENLRHGMLTSSVCEDLMMPLALLLWADIAFPGVDVGAVAKRTLEQLSHHCQAIEQTLLDWHWLDRAGNRRIMLTDCLLWEELDVAQAVFGPHWSLAATPTLARFYEAFPGRARCETLLREQPCPITARPEEAAAIAKIQQLLS